MIIELDKRKGGGIIMKNKIVIIFFIVIFLIALTFLIISKTNKIKVETQIEELVPEEEISDEQLRTTIVTLYFRDKNTGEIMPEARSIDVKEIVDDPYSKIINMLIEGPLNSNFENSIPEGTKLISTYLEQDVLIINFSEEFIEIGKETKENQQLIINSIVSTLVELKEVNCVKFLINGESNINLENSNINLSEGFATAKVVEE